MAKIQKSWGNNPKKKLEIKATKGLEVKQATENIVNVRELIALNKHLTIHNEEYKTRISKIKEILQANQMTMNPHNYLKAMRIIEDY